MGLADGEVPPAVDLADDEVPPDVNLAFGQLAAAPSDEILDQAINMYDTKCVLKCIDMEPVDHGRVSLPWAERD